MLGRCADQIERKAVKGQLLVNRLPMFISGTG
jgi:hypothetical protein